MSKARKQFKHVTTHGARNGSSGTSASSGDLAQTLNNISRALCFTVLAVLGLVQSSKTSLHDCFWKRASSQLLLLA